MQEDEGEVADMWIPCWRRRNVTTFLIGQAIQRLAQYQDKSWGERRYEHGDEAEVKMVHVVYTVWQMVYW